MAGQRIKNIIETQFTEKGAKKVAQGSDQVGRAQTRLGQASASAGRAFSAQASGLGGLVAAYAGAAATVFAITAAFDALNKAARSETIIQGTKALAAEIGQSGPRILKEVKTITQGQIELSEAAQNINIALSAGFNTDQISRLTKVSLGASRALGRNLTDALQRVIRGAAKLEPELLDELGIFTRIDPAVNAYAQKLGVAATTLTDFERRQAFVNAVITEGERKFSSIDTTSNSTQKTLEQLQTQIQELGLEFGKTIATFLVPLVEFLKNNAGNALLLFGGILALVFGKSTEIIGNFAKNSLNNLSDYANTLADSAAKSKGATDVLIKGQKDLAAVVQKNKRGLGGEASFTQGLTRDLSSSAAEARRNFLSGADIGPRQRAKDIDILTRAQNKLTAAGRGQSAAFADADKIIKTYTAAQAGAGLKATVLTKVSVGLQTAIRGVGIAAAFAGKALNVLFLAVSAAQLIGTLFDVDLIGMVTDFFKDLSQKTKDLSNGFLGLTVAAVGGGSALTDTIKRITDDEKVLGKIPDMIRDINESLQSSVNPQRARLGARSPGDDELTIIEALKKRELQEKALRKARKNNHADDIVEAKVQIALIDAIIASTRKFGVENARLAGQLQRNTGLAGEAVAKTFKEGALGVQRLGDKLIIAGNEIAKVDGQFTMADLPKKAQEAVEAQTIFNETLDTTNEAFAAGALNSDKLSAKIAGLSGQLIKIKEGEGSFGISPGPGATGTGEAEKQLKILRAQQIELKAIESTSKGIAKAFSSAFTALDTAPFKGLVNLSGQLSRNAEEAKKNQAEFLMTTMQANQEAATIVRNLGEGEKASADIAERANAFNLSVKAAAGSIIQYNQEALKTLDTEKKKAIQLENQLKALRAQLDIQQLTAALNKDKELNKQAQDTATRANNIFEKRLELTKLQQKVTADEVKAQESLAKAAGNVVKLSRANQRAGMTAANAAREGARTTNQGSLETEIGVLESKAFKNSTVINEKKRALIELERQAANERFTEQKGLIEFDLQTKLLNINAEKASTRQRIESLNKQRKDAVANQSQDLLLFDMQAKAAVTKLQNDKETLRQEGFIALKSADAKLVALDGEEALFRQQSELQIRQLEGFKSFSETVNAFIAGTGAKSPFVQAVAEILGVSQGAEARASFEANLATIPQVTTGNLDSAISAIQGNISGQQEIFNQRRQGIEKEIEASSALNLLKRNGIDTEIKDLKELQKIERDILVKKQNAAIADLDNQIAIERFKLSGLDDENLAAKQQATAAIAGLERQRNDTLLALKDRIDAIKRSEDLLAIAYDNSLAIVEQHLIGAFTSLNEQLINGTLTMDSIGNTFRDMLGGMMKAIQQEVFATTIAKPVAAGISGFIGSLFAGGGPVHMAGGGVMRRDRVHAMLEPGEFVMRKEAVKRIGMDQLQMMNSAIPGGKMEMIKGQPHMQAYITPGEASILKKLGGSGETYKGLPAFADTGGDVDSVGHGMNEGQTSGNPGGGTSNMGGPGPNNPGFGQLGANVSSSAPGGSHEAAQSDGMVSAARGFMARGFTNNQTIAGLVGMQLGLDRNSIDKDTIEADMRDTERAAQDAKDRGKSGSTVSRAISTAINSIVGLAGPPGMAHSVQAQVTGKSIGKSITGSEPFGITDVLGALGFGPPGTQGVDEQSQEEMASGGIVRMAGGGRVNQMRDRVPALLEPGEFVIRKPMAKAIGGKALGAMNATGSVSPGNVSVNINNQGSPKGATVSAPRMNGDKMIIDVITRDLRNNGSIRKSLRGGNY